MAPSLPTVILLGAPGTGAQALASALQARIPASAARIVHIPAPGDASAPACPLNEATFLLLMGLDLPCPASGRPAQEAADSRLRAQLALATVGYRVVYGDGDQRIANALNAINNIAFSAYPSSARGTFDHQHGASAARTARLRAWYCEKCSDPECEHRLFTALTGRDASSA